MRDSIVQVLLTAAEHREAQRLAKSRGLSLSALFRLLMNTEVTAEKRAAK